MQPDDQLFNQTKWCHLAAKYATNASAANWWLNMQVVTFGDQLETIASGAMWSPNLVQVTESSSVSIVPLEIF